MNFKDFCNKTDSLKCGGDKNKQDDFDNKENSLNSDYIENKIKDYSLLNKNELLQEFLKEGGKAKHSGVFTEQKISEYKATLAPFLTDEQKKMFDELVGMVK